MNGFNSKDLKNVFWISLTIKLVLAALIPMTSDETYYWVWTYHPQLSYFDHPAMVAVLYGLGRLFEEMFGFASGVVRWPGVVLAHAALWIWIEIFRRYLKLSPDQIKNWLWLSVLHPLIGAGSIIVTPDIPLLFFWPLALWMYLKLKDHPNAVNAFAFGVALGLGLLSKYMIVLLPLSLAVGLCFELQNLRRLLPFVPIVVLAMVLASLPLWIWNYQNHWISFGFQLDHGITQKPWKASWTYEYVLVQVLILFPPLIYLFFKNLKKSPSWLIAVTVVPLFFFLLTSFRGYVEANWPIMIYPAFLGVVVLGREPWPFVFKFTKIFWGGVIALACALILTNYSPFSKPIKTREFFEFESLYNISKTYSPLFADSYQMASRLSFAANKMVYKLRGINRTDSFDFWDGSQPPDHFYLILREDILFPASYIQQGYAIRLKEKIDSRFSLWEVERMKEKK